MFIKLAVDIEHVSFIIVVPSTLMITQQEKRRQHGVANDFTILAVNISNFRFDSDDKVHNTVFQHEVGV